MAKHNSREEYNAYMRVYMLRKYHARRAEAISYLGGQCDDCGTIDELEIDHISWREKSIPLNKLWSVSKKRFWSELDKCHLLCKRCHIEKTKQDHYEQRLEHGWANQYGSGPMGL